MPLRLMTRSYFIALEPSSGFARPCAELFKEWGRVARTRTSLRLMLNTHRLARGKAQPLDGLVVEILVGQLKAVNRCGETYTEAVALTRNLNALRGVASNEDVLTIVAHAELVALAAKGNAEQLEAKGNAKERNLREQGANGRDGIDHKLGIPRSVRQQHPA